MKELVQIRGRCQETFNTSQKGVTQLHHGIARRNQVTYVLLCSHSHDPHCLQQDCSGVRLETIRTPLSSLGNLILKQVFDPISQG